MAAGTVSLRYFVLGVLAQESMSGYDIKRFLKSLNWLIGSPSGGSLYPILRSLLKEGLVTVEVIPGVDRPPKKVYTITEAGRQEFRSWIEQPVAPGAPLKAFVMRLLLADSHPQRRFLANLQQRRVQVAAHSSALACARAEEAVNDDLGQQLAIDYGLALARAELAWLDSTLERLSRQP